MHIHIRAFPPCGHTSTRWKHSISTIWGLTTMLSFLTHEERMLLFTNGRSSDWLYILPGPSRQSLLFLSVVRNWLIDKMLYRVSQQRDCPGVTPDSLLIRMTKVFIRNQFGTKIRIKTNRWRIVNEKYKIHLPLYTPTASIRLPFHQCLNKGWIGIFLF